MRKILWFVLPLALLLSSGCAVEEPYPPWPSPPPAALSPEDVVTLLLAGIPEDEVLVAIRTSGISARPTAAEIQALRLVGASDRLLTGILGASVEHPRIEAPGLAWLPPPPLPGCWPMDLWLWLEGKLKAFPQPLPPIEAEP